MNPRCRLALVGRHVAYGRVQRLSVRGHGFRNVMGKVFVDHGRGVFRQKRHTLLDGAPWRQGSSEDGQRRGA